MTESEIQDNIRKIRQISGIELQSLNHGTSDKINPNEIDWSHAHLYVPSENKVLSNGPYFYSGERIVHFTSESSLKAILITKSIRLSNLHKLNDPREFSFAGDLFDLTVEEREQAKSHFYVMSFCDSSILSAQEIAPEFNLWRLYGKHGKGVAIEFSIVTNPRDWFELHMSNVIYDSRNRNVFKELYQAVQDLKDVLSIDVQKLCAFHKSRIYNIEREVRILYDGRPNKAGLGGRRVEKHGEFLFPILESDSKNPIVRYLRLPLFTPNLIISDYDHVPVLKIEKIHAGYQRKYDANRKRYYSNLARKNLGYTPEVCFSRLVEAYWGRDLY